MEWLVIILVVGVICGALAANIASSKGHDGTAWFFAGFFLGIFGLIASVGLSNRSSKTDAQAGQVKKCPMCAESVLAEAKICRFCHYEFPQTPEEAPEAKAKRLQEEKSKREAAERARAEEQKRDKKVGLIILASVVILLVVMWIVVSVLDKSQVAPSKPSAALGPVAGGPIASEKDRVSKAGDHERRSPQKPHTPARTVPYKTQQLRRHLIRLRYPSGSEPTFTIDETFIESDWNSYSIGDSMSPRRWSSERDTWVLVSPRIAGPGASIGVITRKIDTLVTTEE